jgi:hypothetical protein
MATDADPSCSAFTANLAVVGRDIDRADKVAGRLALGDHNRLGNPFISWYRPNVITLSYDDAIIGQERRVGRDHDAAGS